MPTSNRGALLHAVNILVADCDSSLLGRTIKLVKVANQVGIELLPVGEAAELLPLAQLAVDNVLKFRNVLELINQRRHDAGLPPLVVEGVTDETSETSRKDYLAQHMREKRARERRIVDAWNSMRSAHDALKGQARMDFQRLHANRWFDAKQQREHDLEVKLGRTPRREELQALQELFWEEVDQELADLEAFAREEMRKPLSQRSPNGFTFRIKRRE